MATPGLAAEPVPIIERSLLMADYQKNKIKQIKPTGAAPQMVNLVNLQYSHFVTDNSCLLVGGDVGCRGMPLYNQIFWGAGYRYSPAPRFHIRGQLSMGSGGYDPEKIDTASGLLIYPKLFAEYMVSDSVGVYSGVRNIGNRRVLEE